MLHGKCSCGATSFAIDALPREVHFCHCSMCRRATGSVFAVLAWCLEKDVTWYGDAPREYRSSSRAVRGFCASCGSPLYIQHDGNDEIGLHVGAFDEPQVFVPTRHDGVESRLGWVDISAGLPSEPSPRRSIAQAMADLPLSLQKAQSAPKGESAPKD